MKRLILGVALLACGCTGGIPDEKTGVTRFSIRECGRINGDLAHLIKDTETGEEYLCIYHGGIVRLEKPKGK